MNEKIRELAEQAWDSLIDEMGDKMFSNRDTGQFSTEFLHAYDQRFAELIVRKCAEISKNYAGGSMPLSIALAIKEHFGVKE